MLHSATRFVPAQAKLNSEKNMSLHFPFFLFIFPFILHSPSFRILSSSSSLHFPFISSHVPFISLLSHFTSLSEFSFPLHVPCIFSFMFPFISLSWSNSFSPAFPFSSHSFISSSCPFSILVVCPSFLFHFPIISNPCFSLHSHVPLFPSASPLMLVLLLNLCC